MLLLFQQLTGDGWSGVMNDLMVTTDRGCDHDVRATAWAPPGNCGTLLSLPYFFSFQIIGGMVGTRPLHTPLPLAAPSPSPTPKPHPQAPPVSPISQPPP